MKLTNEDYVARISSASPLQLVIINYELAVRKLHEAKERSEDGDTDGFTACISKARDFLMLLMKSLDMTYAISKDLMRTYFFIDRLLVRAYYSKSHEASCDACDLMGTLLESWRALERVEKEPQPVMENTQKVFAGLTYKNGKLTEYVEEKNNRGFKA